MENIGRTEAVDLGGLRFVVMHRTYKDDGGPTIEVYGDVAGEPVQVLRFDCFRHAPHFHYAPTGANVHGEIDPSKNDPVEWAMAQIQSRLPAMLRIAGYRDLADRVDAKELSMGWTKIVDAIRATAPSAT